jgi:hypothetical protein
MNILVDWRFRQSALILNQHTLRLCLQFWWAGLLSAKTPAAVIHFTLT